MINTFWNTGILQVEIVSNDSGETFVLFKPHAQRGIAVDSKEMLAFAKAVIEYMKKRNRGQMKKYTIIKPDPELQNNLMAFGFMCDKGWYPLLEELLDKIQAIIDSNPDWNDFELTEVKEKYGELRVYCNYYPDEIWDLIEEYRKRSLKTCEVCGEKGTLKEKHKWYKTLCDKCYEEWMK